MYLNGDFSAIRIKGILTFEIEKFANTVASVESISKLIPIGG